MTCWAWTGLCPALCGSRARMVCRLRSRRTRRSAASARRSLACPSRPVWRGVGLLRTAGGATRARARTRTRTHTHVHIRTY
eukprot:6086511-Lingulodinium_polyedra.AAC.1